VLDADLDLLVLGSGVAGLSAAVRAAEAHQMRVGVLTKGELPQSTTRWAQGGIAAVLVDDPDSTDLHLADTLAAGVGLCDADAVRVLVDEGPLRVHELISLGAMFDRDERGDLELAHEGGHTMARVVHAGGSATGVEVERALVVAVQKTMAAIHEHAFALDLVVEGGRCTGVSALFADGTTHVVRARNVLVTTGGAGQLFAVTTNPVEATGDGIAMALRAGVAVADIEFIQFHPTALSFESMPRPLLSEALRGHGALLRDTTGERFVDEMLPRDVVSRAETRRMIELGADHVFLDARHLDQFDQRFPNIALALRQVGLDPANDLLPVAPAAHYACGGIVTDLCGASSLPGLWAAGEAACSGVHGANRLASNSLLEGMVFGPRAVEAIEQGIVGPEASGAMRSVLGADADRPDAVPAGVIGGRFLRLDPPLDPVPATGTDGPAVDPDVVRDRLQRAMTRTAGVLRSAQSLDAAAAEADLAMAALRRRADRRADRSGTVAGCGAAAPLPHETGDPSAPDLEGEESVAAYEARNLATVARALAATARQREESRGAHTRIDFPDRSAELEIRIVVV
jgi:L-aspartate oxidase